MPVRCHHIAAALNAVIVQLVIAAPPLGVPRGPDREGGHCTAGTSLSGHADGRPIGTVAGVTAAEAAEIAPVPNVLTACTRKLYAVPLVSPVTVVLVNGPLWSG